MDNRRLVDASLKSEIARSDSGDGAADSNVSRYEPQTLLSFFLTQIEQGQQKQRRHPEARLNTVPASGLPGQKPLT